MPHLLERLLRELGLERGNEARGRLARRVRDDVELDDLAGGRHPAEAMPLRLVSRDAVTMDKIVSLSKRRGFVFPSSEIYGGLGSSYDYGHYGVLLKDNVKARWLEAMVRERDDIVALDSSIILHPKVWEASGHVSGFSDPLVDCRICKQRFRADHLRPQPRRSLRQAADRSGRARRPTAT